MLWLATGVVVFVGVFGYCTDGFRAAGERNLFHYYGQKNLVVSDGWMYYCDVLRENALCGYHPETKQIQIIEEAEGVLKKKGTGVYYIVGNVVYRIEDTQLSEVHRIPAERFSFVDCYKDTVYWIARLFEEIHKVFLFFEIPLDKQKNKCYYDDIKKISHEYLNNKEEYKNGT